MDVKEEEIEKKIAEYKMAAEQHRNNAIANDGAAQALLALLEEARKEKECQSSS
jgi:demethoxyubiquinone hydroxylase (CLK1/Coq7/Cat5 family)